MDVAMGDSETKPSAEHNTVAIADYAAFWERLSFFVQLALRSDLQDTHPLCLYSHEELYRSIYWTCWRGLQGRLFEDLKNVIRETLEFLNGQLQSCQDLDDFIMKFAAILSNHLRAIDVLGSIFAYLDNTYINGVLNDNLRHVMVDSFMQTILKESERQLMYIFKKIFENPNANKIKDIVRDLFKMSSDSIYLNPLLFESVIIGIRLPPNVEDLRMKYRQLDAKYNIMTNPKCSLSKRTASAIDEDDCKASSSKRRQLGP
ncbi:411_t:CDS:2 [Paraglomus occultum]|uniref:411_t:CDS:1 n=1 Tax=Paraglomus occultum TaxID=144539 RepID=A0A9N9FIE2_9GLOM|nr:411_t:CDS:2 [Paraglomus occultum]